jgi:hypothetical protein
MPCQKYIAYPQQKISLADIPNPIHKIGFALAHLLIPALIIINAWHPVCVKVKCQSAYFYTSACLPALMKGNP